MDNSSLYDLEKGQLCLVRRTGPKRSFSGSRKPSSERSTSIQTGAVLQMLRQGHWAKVSLLSGNEVCDMKVSLLLLAPVLTPDCMAKWTGKHEHSKIANEASYFG